MKKLALLGLAALVFFGCERRDEVPNNQNRPANVQINDQNGRNGANGSNGSNTLNVYRNGNGTNTPRNGNGSTNGSVNGGR